MCDDWVLGEWENGLVVQADAQTRSALLEILELFCSRLAAGDEDGVMQLFAPDPDIVIVTPGEPLLRGSDEVKALLHRYAQGTTRYSWTWDRRDVSAAGAVGWLLAEGTQTVTNPLVSPVGLVGMMNEEQHPYRMSLVRVKRDDRWLLVHIHGSFPH